MSFDVRLIDLDGNTLQVEKHSEGGNYVVGGTIEASLNITYNYSWFYMRFLHDDGLLWLDGKKAKHCIAALEKAIAEFGVARSGDYWSPTPGNAGYALNLLLKWANQHPEGVFEVI